LYAALAMSHGFIYISRKVPGFCECTFNGLWLALPCSVHTTAYTLEHVLSLLYTNVSSHWQWPRPHHKGMLPGQS
jgi:hypothetical protein